MKGIKTAILVIVILLAGLGIGLLMPWHLQVVPDRSHAQKPADSKTAPTIKPNPTVQQLEDTFAKIAENIEPAVVNISTSRTLRYRDPFYEFFYGPGQGQQYEQSSLGSGFVVRSDGYIMTNNHVVAQADQISVRVTDPDNGMDTEYEASIVGTDPETDLAIIKIKPKKPLPAAPLGDSESVRVGDFTMAVGSPFGLANSVTTGIISAKARSLAGHSPYYDYLQTDAAINPGNSGGPLINLRGQVIGVNTAIISRSGGYMGIGFAIPINLARDVMEDIIRTGHSRRGYLGVTIQEMNDKLAKSLGLNSAAGVLVTGVVRGGPASDAGLRRGDVIIAVDSTKVNAPAELQRAIGLHAPGDTVTITAMRGGQAKTFKIKLIERPS